MGKLSDMSFECAEHKIMFNALQEMINAGERVNLATACKRAAVNKEIFSNKYTKNTWKTEIRQLIDQENTKWLEHGGSDYKKIESALEKFIKDGKRPQVNPILREAGRNGKYFTEQVFPWKLKLLKKIEKAELRWQKNGGADYKKIESVLEKFIKEGKRPLLTYILKEARRDNNYFCNNVFPWKLKLLKKIEKAELRWQKNGGADYKKLKIALNKIIKSGERPSKEKVLKGSGFSHKYLNTIAFPWQAKIKDEIADTSLTWRKSKRFDNERNKKIKNVELNGYIPHMPTGKSIDEVYERFIKQSANIEEYKDVGINLNSRLQSLPLSVIMYSASVTTDDVYKPRWVKPESFQQDRRPLLDALIKIVYGKRKNQNTLYGYFRECMIFISFLHENKLAMPLNINDARTALQEYTLNLKGRILQGENTDTAKIRFNMASMFIKTIFTSVDDQTIIFRKIRFVSHAERTQNNTSLDIAAAAYAISYYYNFFHKISDFILQEKSFPYKVHILDTYLLLAPWGKTFIINEDISHPSNNPWIYFDSEGERVLSKTEMLARHQEMTEGWDNLSPREKQYREENKIQRLKKIELNISEANNDPLHQIRMVLAEKAMKAFFMFFCAVTAMKDSELANIEWGKDDSFEVIKGAGKLVTIKPRAYYKEIESTIHRVGIFSLRKALKLRRYLLQGNECKKLFFEGYGESIKTDGALVAGNYGRKCKKYHQVINPGLPDVGTRQLRVFKNKIVLQQTGGDLWLAAALIGNKPATNAEFYQGDTQEKMDAKLNTFVDSMVSTMKKGLENSVVTPTPQSHCEDYGSPESFVKDKKLDCNSIFACFFCKHYRVYPEKEDIHKLVSLRFIIRRIGAGRSYDQNQFDTLMKPVEKLIDRLLIVMAKKHGTGALINTVQEMVFKRGTLHPYWEFKLRYLYEIGAF